MCSLLPRLRLGPPPLLCRPPRGRSRRRRRMNRRLLLAPSHPVLGEGKRRRSRVILNGSSPRTAFAHALPSRAQRKRDVCLPVIVGPGDRAMMRIWRLCCQIIMWPSPTDLCAAATHCPNNAARELTNEVNDSHSSTFWRIYVALWRNRPRR